MTNAQIADICKEALNGKLSADSFYDKLTAAAEDETTDGDMSCLLEDVIMEMEMAHDRGGSKKVMQQMTAECARRILDEGIF